MEITGSLCLLSREERLMLYLLIHGCKTVSVADERLGTLRLCSKASEVANLEHTGSPTGSAK